MDRAELETATMSDDEYMSTGDPHDDDEDYRPRTSPVPTLTPGSPGKQPKKRGRKPNPNPSVRTAREAARKANHSVIEKKRREKINQTLSELRSLVPASQGLTNETNSKDFKLEVLVRSVTHLKVLIGRVRELEATVAATERVSRLPHSTPHCQHCKGELSTRQDQRSPRIELPPVSSILTGLPSPPSSGSLAISTSMTEVPSLHLPGSSISTSPSTSPSSPHHPLHEQAVYSLLHLSARQRAAAQNRARHDFPVAETPRSILGMSPVLPAQGRRA